MINLDPDVPQVLESLTAQRGGGTVEGKLSDACLKAEALGLIIILDTSHSVIEGVKVVARVKAQITPAGRMAVQPDSTQSPPLG